MGHALWTGLLVMGVGLSRAALVLQGKKPKTPVNDPTA